MKHLIIITVIMLTVSSCTTTRTVEVEKVRDVYHHSVDTVRDSVFRDVWHNTYIKGDTVFNEKTEYIYKWRYISNTDTLIDRDTIPLPVTVEKSVEKELAWWQITLMVIGCITILLFGGTVVSFLTFKYNH